MDNKELLIVGAVALGAYFLFFRKGPPSPAVAPQQPVQPIYTINPQPAPVTTIDPWKRPEGYVSPYPLLSELPPINDPWKKPAGFVSAYPTLPELAKQVPFASFVNPANIPLWLGTSPVAAEITHQLNEVFTHLIGQETGLEKGNITLMTSTGPFILSRSTGKCYNLGGKEITCPAGSTVTGIERHSYEQLIKEGLS